MSCVITACPYWPQTGVENVNQMMGGIAPSDSRHKDFYLKLNKLLQITINDSTHFCC